jgi:integrase
MNMKTRFRLYQRGGFKKKKGQAVWYSWDNKTGEQKSLRTKDETEAKRLIAALNEGYAEPAIRRQIAQNYLHGDEQFRKRTWRYVLDRITEQKQDSTKARWLNVARDKNLSPLWDKPLVETQADDLLRAMTKGTVSTNVYLRRLHNYALDMDWILRPIIVRRQWPRFTYGEHRAIKADEHRRIVERELHPERRLFYELCWHLGGSQGDIAKLQAESIDWQNRSLQYRRRKSKVPAIIQFGANSEAILRQLPSTGPLFPYLATVRSGDRATEFKQRCVGLGIEGVTLHSYRYSWSERAKRAGYPVRFAMENLGHSSKAVAHAYASQAEVTLPSLEEYEAKAQTKIVWMPVGNSGTIEKLEAKEVAA